MIVQQIEQEIDRLKKSFVMVLMDPKSINQHRVSLALGRDERDALADIEGAVEELREIGVDILPVDAASFIQAYWRV